MYLLRNAMAIIFLSTLFVTVVYSQENFPKISISGETDRSWVSFDRPFVSREKYSFSVTNESNVNILAYYKNDNTTRSWENFLIAVEGSDISEGKFAIWANINCEASYPVKWIYSGNGWVPANVKHSRKIVDKLNGHPIYSYSSTIVFEEMSPFVNESSGNYTCVKRNMTDQDDLSGFPYYNMNVVNASSFDRPSFNSPANSKCVQTTDETDLINMFYNEADSRFYCCSNNRNPSKLEMLTIYCETPDSCNLKRNCPDAENSCVNFYNESTYNEQLGLNCLQTEFENIGEFDCFVDDQCTKMMGHSNRNNITVLYPLDDPSSTTFPDDAVLRLDLNERGNNQYEIRCEGPHFYLEHGFVWGLVFQNGSQTLVNGEDGSFGGPRQAYSTLYIDVVEANCEDLVEVICIAPLLNNSTEWINKSISFLDGTDSKNRERLEYFPLSLIVAN